jgi:photosystem II stability/assembly factor-like uncharacterized protein
MKKLILIFVLLVPACFGQFAWTDQSPAGVSDDIWCVKYANENFVAVTGKGRVLTSTDGTSWSVQTLNANTWLVSVTYGGGLWVVVGEGGIIYYSADLKSWTAAKAVTTSKLNGVAYVNKTYVAVGEGGVIATSSDAQNWTLRTSGTTNFLHGVASDYPANSSIYATGAKGTILRSSDFGVTWSNASNDFYFFPPSNGLNTLSDDIEVAEYGPYFNGTSGSRRIGVAGSNGLAWARTGLSSDVPQNLPSAPVFRGLTYGAKNWVVAGDRGIIYTSPDGAKWTQRFSGDSPATVSTDTLLSIAYAETLQKFVAVGGNGRILVSSAPATTFINVATRGTVVPSDPLIGGFVISGTAQKNVLIRAVGPTLSSFGVTAALADPVLTVYDSRNVIVATNSSWGTNSNVTALVSATLRSGFPLTAGSKDCALYLTLAPGSYTAIIRSASNATGTVLFEAYAN